jgi:hypothetical protein
MPVKAGYLLAAGAGAIVLYAGVRGYKWTTVLRDVLSGKQVTSHPEELAIETSPAAFASGGSGSVSTAGPLPLGGTSIKNLAIGRAMAAVYGWTGSEWDSLKQLWTGESNWDNHAKNPSSGAYGIPQALPGSKMGPLANPPISSAGAQIAWGLKYIKQMYGSPSRALAIWQSRSPHWY